MNLFRWALGCVLLCLLNAPADAAGGRHVYLLRGIFNVSVGLDVLAGKLAAIGIPASVHDHGDAGPVAAAALRDFHSGRVRSIVLIGHSLGGGAAISVAQQLNSAGVPVSLVVLLDPVSTGAVPPNVRRAVNFYVPGGMGAAVGAEAGFRGRLTNVDVPAMDHMTVQAAASMHSRIIGEVQAATAMGRGTAAR